MKHFTISISLITLLALSSEAALAAINVSDDLYSIPSDGILLVEADGVITNDTMDDADGSPQFVLDIAQNHTLSLITPPSEGTLRCGNTVNTICADGSFTYTVSPTSFTGVDSFTYRLEVDSGLASNEFADATVVLSSCNNNGTVTTCWTENAFFTELATLEDPGNPYYVKHEGFEGVDWDAYRSYQDANFNWIYNGATTIASKGIDWSSNHPTTNIISTSEGATLSGIYGLFDPDHGHATNTSTGSCQALEAADPNGVVPEECLPHDGFSGTSASTLYAVGGYIKGSNSAANISVATDGGPFTNIGKLVTPAHQFYGIIDTNGFTSFRFHDIDGKTGQPLYIFGDDFYLVTRDPVDANNAPVVGSVSNQSVVAGTLFQIDIPVSDPDNDAMAYVLSGVPTTGTGRARLIDNGSSIRVRWITPTDSAGLYSVTITVTDNGYPRITQVLNFDLTITPPPPTLSLPGNITQEADSAAGSVVNFSVSATDVTDGSLTPSCTAVSGSIFALGSTTIDCSVTNSSSLTTTGSFQVSIVDTTVPVVTAPAALLLEASGATTAVSLGSASVSDLVSAGLIAVPDNTGPFAVGIHQVTWSATDTAGNTGSAIQTVTIVDTIAPSINLPANISTEATGSAGAIVNFSASGNDVVSGTIAAVCVPASGSTFALGITAVNCSVTDGSGNAASGSFNVTVEDTTLPVVTAPANITTEATGTTTAVALGTASATDLVSGSLSPTADNTGPFTVGTHSITWSATDGAGNTGSATQSVTITDTSGPVLSLPADFNAEATASNGASVNYTANANDLVDGAVVIDCTPASGSTFALGTTLVSCSASDNSNHTSSGSFNITVEDTTPPVVSAPLDISMEATGATTAVSLGTASATDAVTTVLTASANNTGPFSVGVHSITWSATDSAGNTGTATQTVTITDTGAPTLNLPAAITMEATTANGVAVTYSATANDIVDGALIADCIPASGSIFALGTTVVNCSVTDSANLTSSASFNVSVVDTTAPTVSVPLNITMEATGATTAVDLGIATATDAVTSVLTPLADNTGPYTVGVHTITWSATDAANNTGTATQTVTITDTVAPALDLPANISQGATSSVGAVVNYSVTANDIADGSIVPSCSPVSGSTFVLGTTVVNCSASDSANNSTSGSFNVTITDTGAPSLSLPGNISAEATAASGAIVTYTASATDAIDGPLTAACLPASGSTFALGDHVVNCSAQDLEGNTASGSFIVSIVDTTAPSVTAPADITIEASGAATSVTLGVASATDLVNGILIPTVSNSGPFTVGVHIVTWSATDAANNTGTATQTVTVTDTAAPVLSLPLGISQEATSASGAVVNYTATANDIVDGALALSCVPASGSTFALGTTVVNCSVTDSANLTTSGSFNVTIVDSTAPVVIAPANISIEATGATTAVALGSATANDSVSGVLTAVADNDGPFTVGTHTITWSATDAANNTGSATQVVTITDIGSPSLSLPANISAEATSASGAVVSYTVSASDVVDGSLTATCTPVSGSTFALGSTSVNCSATDSSNLTTSGSFTVTVEDTIGPDLVLPADTNVNSTSSTGAITRYAASAIDAVDGSVLPDCAPASGSNFALGTTVVTCSATDSANNTSTGSFNVTVIDITANNQPVANAGNPQIVVIGSQVMLNGSASNDLDGDTLTYQWSLTVPTGSTAVLTQPTSANPNFTADVEGIYSAQLIVNDGTVSSVPNVVMITAQLPVDAAPVIYPPANIRVPSTGYLTPVNLGLATATDSEDGALQPTADNLGPFTTGYHEVTWRVTDSGNNTASAIQTVEVLPMVNFQLNQQAEVGALINIDLNMNGLAPQYPVDLNYDITVNGSTSSNTLSIASGKTAAISYQIPATANGGDTITFSLTSVANAVPGANSTHSITLIDTNVAPIVEIEVTQNSVVTKNVHINAGLATVTAKIQDANQSDTHILDWSTTDNNLSIPGSVKVFTIDPSSLVEGIYKIGVKVVDSGLLEAENEIYLRVITQDFNPPAGSDSDGDGVEDALEGDQDDDNDGIPNYLDAIGEQLELLQMQAGESSKWVLATESGLSLRLGKIAQLSEKYGANLNPADLAQFASLGRIAVTSDPNDSDYTSSDGYLDFTINGLTKPGQSVKLVIPLLSPIPDQAVYRKYSPDTGWSTFVEDTANVLASAPGADGICPAPGSSDYQTGLAAGDYCIQMTIQDGGPNDNDLLRNGVITDPGGVAVAATPTTNPPTTTPPTTTSSGGGGGGVLDMPILFGMILLLAISIAFRIGIVRSAIIGGGGIEREFEYKKQQISDQ